jgi:hypothetical protein
MRNLGWFASTPLALLCSGCSAFRNPQLTSALGVLARAKTDFSSARERPGFMGDTLTRLAWLSAMLCTFTMLAGCSLSHPTNNPFTTPLVASNGKPMVWDCSVTYMASPPRYACGDNKTYTAFELRDARLGLTPAQAAGKL